jgi:hypothetical protein
MRPGVVNEKAPVFMPGLLSGRNHGGNDDGRSRVDLAWLGATEASEPGFHVSGIGASARAANSFPFVARHETSFGKSG